MTVHYPEGVQAQGNLKVKAVIGGVTSRTAPSLAEIDDPTSVDLSCFLYPAGWVPSVTTNKGTKPPRLCSKDQLEQFNRSTFGMADLLYAWDPQGADTDPDNKAYATLTEGIVVDLVERMGGDSQDEPLAIGDWVRVHTVRLGPQIPVGDPTDENAEFQIQQPAIYTVTPGPRAKIVA